MTETLQIIQLVLAAATLTALLLKAGRLLQKLDDLKDELKEHKEDDAKTFDALDRRLTQRGR